MAPLLQHRMAPLASGRYARLHMYWPNRLHHRLSIFKRPAAIGRLRASTTARRTALWGTALSKKRAAIIIAATPPRVPLQPKRLDIEHVRDEPSWRQNLPADGWDRQPTEAPTANAEQSRYGGVPFEAEQAEPSAQRPGSGASAEISAGLLSTLKAVLGTLDTLKREDYAIGVTAIALGVGAARATEKVVPALPQLAHGSTAAVKGLGNGFTRSQDQAATRACQWLQSPFEDMRQQAAISKESLEEWPELLQGSMLRSAEKHKAAVQQLRSNVGQWAEEVQESVSGVSAVQSLWKSAAAAARRYQSEISCESQSRPFQAATPQLELSALSLGPIQEPEQATNPAASLAASKPAAMEMSPAAALEKPRHEALPPAKASPAEALLPAPKECSPARKPGRSDTQVYAAEAEAAKAKTAAKQAEEAWNERIKGAYAAIAAATPYRPATKKSSSHALSWHRGGNTTLLKPDFQLPKRGADESSPGSGGGSGSAGGSGAGGGSGGGDDSEGSEQPERNPRSWLWAQVLVLAAAAEQGLSWPRRQARFMAALAVLGFLAYAGLVTQNRTAGKNRRKVSCNPFGRFGFGGRKSSLVDVAVGELMEFSDDETF